MYTWTISNGAITGGNGTTSLTFTAGTAGSPVNLSCTVTNVAGSAQTGNVTVNLLSSKYMTITPSTAVVAPGAYVTINSDRPVVWVSGENNYDINISSTWFWPFEMSVLCRMPDQIGTYELDAYSTGNPSLKAEVYITVVTPGSPVINSFTASSTSVHAGQPVTLSWNVSNATSVNLSYCDATTNGYFYSLPISTGNTSLVVYPKNITKYKLDASENGFGTVNAFLTVNADMAPTITSFTVSPASLTLGDSSQLSATFTNGTGSISEGVGPVQSGVPVTESPTKYGKYTLSVTNPYGATATKDLNLNVLVSGQYSTLPNMQQAQAASQPGLLRDGRVLFVGGTTKNWNGTWGPTTGAAQVFDSASGTFQSVGSLVGERVGHTATSCSDGRVLVWGGIDGNYSPERFLNTFEIFDPKSNAFSSYDLGGTYTQNSIVSRIGHTATQLADGRVLIAGGQSIPDGLNQVSNSDLVSIGTSLLVNLSNPFQDYPTFVVTGAMTTPRTGHVSVRLMDGRVLVAGGGNQVTSFTSAELYDPAKGTWSLAGNLSQAAHAKNPILLPDGRVLFDGLEIFDPATSTFSPLASPYTGFSGFGGNAVLLPNGMIHMGYLPSSTSVPVLYDFVLNACYGTVNPSPVGSSDDITLLQDGTLLFAGGQDPRAVRFDSQSPLSVQPALGHTNVGLSLTLRASGQDSAGAIWSASGGTILQDDTFQAQTAGTYAVTATASTGARSTAWVEVHPAIQVIIGTIIPPAPGGFNVGVPGAIHARVLNTPNQGVNWSVQEGGVAGTITGDGIFTGTTPGICHVVATSMADPTRFVSAAIVVNPSGGGPIQVPVISTFASDTPTVEPGRAANLSWNVIGAYQLVLTGGGLRNDVTGLTGMAVFPTANTQYQLTALNSVGSSYSQTITIHVSTMPVTISISPMTATIYAGQSMVFGFSLSAPTNRVTWSATGGSITPTGAYTAPAQPGTYTVTVTSVDDPRQSATATVTVQTQMVVPVSVQISPSTLDIYTSKTFILGTSVSAGLGRSTDVTWTATGGAIVSLDGNSGYFTAPSAIGACTVTATSVADPTKSASCVVNVKSASVTLAITPLSVELGPGGSYKFGTSMQVTGSSDTNLTWKTEAGTIVPYPNGSALYQAPLNAGTYQVSAVSNADPRVFATAMVTVNPGKSFLTITPSEIHLSMGATQSFTVQGSNLNGAVQWSIAESGGGTIGSGGFYTAPTTQGTYTVVAQGTSTSGDSLFASAKVTVGSLVIQAPSQLTLLPGDSYAFKASQINGSTFVLTWSIDEGLLGGTITSGGAYTAPLQAGFYHVRVSNAGGESVVQEVLVTLIDAIGISPKVEILEEGDYLLSVSLQASNGKRTTRKASLHLTVGIQEPELTFGADSLKTELGVDGSYQVVDVRIEKSTPDDVVPADSPMDLGATAAYRMDRLERPWITAGGLVLAEALDLNGNGLADQLRVTFAATLVSMGSYEWSGALVDADGLVIGYAYGGPTQLPAGAIRLPLIFSGTAINSHGKDGPYYLKNILLQGPVLGGSGDWSGAITGYTASQFDPPAAPLTAPQSQKVNTALP